MLHVSHSVDIDVKIVHPSHHSLPPWFIHIMFTCIIYPQPLRRKGGMFVICPGAGRLIGLYRACLGKLCTVSLVSTTTWDKINMNQERGIYTHGTARAASFRFTRERGAAFWAVGVVSVEAWRGGLLDHFSRMGVFTFFGGYSVCFFYRRRIDCLFNFWEWWVFVVYIYIGLGFVFVFRRVKER